MSEGRLDYKERRVFGKLGLACDRATVDDWVLDVVHVDTTLDLEEAIVTPIFVPAVCDQPVVHAVLSAVAHDLDCVTTKHWVDELAGVDSSLVRQEALVDEEHAGDGAILVNLLFHSIGTCAIALLAHAVAASTTMLGSFPVLAVVTCTLACRSLDLTSAVRVLPGSGVMCARLELVRSAHRLVSIITSIDNAKSAVVRVNSGRNATIAPHVTKVITCSNILSREMNVLAGVAGDADAISHRLDGAECPAGAAVGLIANLLHAGAACSARVCAPIEFIRNVSNSLWHLWRQEGSHICVLKCAHQDLGIPESGTLKNSVPASNPSLCLVVVVDLDVIIAEEGRLGQLFLVH